MRPLSGFIVILAQQSFSSEMFQTRGDGLNDNSHGWNIFETCSCVDLVRELMCGGREKNELEINVS